MSVYPFRLPDVAAAVEEARAVARARGMTRFEWWIAPDAEPADLAARLREHGLTDDPPAAAMVIFSEPPAAEGITARQVVSIDELRTALEIAHAAFEDRPERLQAALEGLPDQWEREGVESATFLAFLAGKAVGAARSVYLDEPAVLLVSGSVAKEARGRGAYRALVRARWDDAVARGKSALLVFAGPMSRPILERSGFEPMFELRILGDDL